MFRVLSERSLTVLAAVLVLLMFAIVAQVLCSALDINPVWSTSTPMFLIGDAITLNSLLDFQWHLLVFVALLPAGILWIRDKHVRVDFIYSARSPRYRKFVDLIGNLLFALPFFILMVPAAWDFAMRAWSSGEGSRNGGLNDLWLIKATLPIGIALLALAALYETVRLIRARHD